MLHEQTLELFVNSPGFGVGRMFDPAGWNLANRRSEYVPAQSGPRETSVWSTGDFQRPATTDEPFQAWMVEDSLIDFANPRGFG
jgi:hypothetical protein